jgi:hypothetical protein
MALVSLFDFCYFKGERQFVRMHTMEASGQFRPPANLHLASIGYETEWASKVVWVLGRREKVYIHAGNRTTIPRMFDRQLSHYTD